MIQLTSLYHLAEAAYLEVDGTWANSGTITSSGAFEGA